MDYTHFDKLADEGKFNQVLDELNARNSTHPNDPQILFRLGRIYWELGQEKPPSEKSYRQEMFTKGLENAKKALEISSEFAPAHKWIAILTGSMGDYVSIKEKIEDSYKIKEHALKASQLNPNDPTPYHILGVWCQNVTNISWVERKIASTLFATPPESSYEEAAEYFQKSATLDPTFRRNSLQLAETYRILKKK